VAVGWLGLGCIAHPVLYPHGKCIHEKDGYHNRSDWFWISLYKFESVHHGLTPSGTDNARYKPSSGDLDAAQDQTSLLTGSHAQHTASQALRGQEAIEGTKGGFEVSWGSLMQQSRPQICPVSTVNTLLQPPESSQIYRTTAMMHQNIHLHRHQVLYVIQAMSLPNHA
jgi:hypothetical protein